MNKKAVILLSGGVDSTTAAYKAYNEGYDLYALTIEYGHRAKPEIECAKRTASKICKDHKVLNIDVLKEIWNSPLINMEIKEEENDRDGNSYYVVPLRNIVFLSIAHAYAQTIGAEVVIIGNQEDDAKGFPDCSMDAMNAFNTCICYASEEGKKSVTWSPWIWTKKEDIIAYGIKHGVLYEDTYSCYDDNIACGICESCMYRLEAFKNNGIEDPIPYKNK